MRTSILLLLLQLAAGCRRDAARCQSQSEHQQWQLAAMSCERSFFNGRGSDGLRAARAWINLGKDESAAKLVEPLRRAGRIGDADQIAGIVAKRGGEPATARTLLLRALATHQRLHDHLEAARDAHALAGANFAAAEYRDALEHFQTCYDEADRAGEGRLKAFALLGLADVLTAIGDVDAAEGALSVAAKGLSSFPGDLCFVRMKQGILWFDNDDLGLAQNAFTDALELSRKAGRLDVEMATEFRLSEVLREGGRGRDAEKHLTAARDLVQRSGGKLDEDPAYLYHLAGQEQLEGRRQHARELLGRLSQVTSSGYWAWVVPGSLGRLAAAEGDLDTAEAEYRKAIASIERVRAALEFQELKCWLLGRQRQSYVGLFLLLVRRHRLMEALGVFESLQARTWIDAYSKVRAVSSDTGSPTFRFGRAFRSTPAQPPPTVEVTVRALGARTVIGYLEASGQVWVVMLRNGRPHIRLLPISTERARELVGKLVANPEDADAARALGAALIPSDVFAAPDAVTYFIASGAFVRVPFAALFVNGRRLLETTAVAMVPSASALASILSRESPPRHGVAVFGDSLSDLPGARRESAWVAQNFGLPPRVGPEVTRRALCDAARDAELLHVASHAGVGADGGWLQLADGALSAADIIDEHLRPRLVVLASCSSASARDQESWGALASAFLASGSDAVVATLWSVDDQTTFDFVSRFYSARSAQAPAAALATAQRQMSATHSPRDWAPFVLVGAAE